MNEAPRTLPHNLEAERAVLGAILIENKAYPVASAILPSGRYFFRDAHRRIYKAMQQLDERNEPIELVTLKNQLERNADLDEVGGPMYISALVDGVPLSTNVPHYAEIVKDKAALRELVFTANAILGEAYEAATPAVDVLRWSEQKLFDLTNGHIPSKMQDLKSGVADLYREIEFRMENKGAVTGVPTGFSKLDAHTLGWQPGNLIFIGARPSIGKTTFAVNSAVAAAKGGKRIAIFSMEMDRNELKFRILSELSGVGLTRILNGALGALDWPKISQAMVTMDSLPLEIDDQPARTFMDIRSTCRQMQSDRGLDSVVIDYAQLFRGSLERKGANRNEELSDISNRLKALARELRCPIIILSQIARVSLSRPDPRPKISDLKDCGAFEQDADLVMLLHRRKHEEDGPTELILAKMRNGKPGSFWLDLNSDTVTFTDGEAPAEEPKEPAPATSEGREPYRRDPSMLD